METPFTASNGMRFEVLDGNLVWSTDLYPEPRAIGEPIDMDGPGYGVGSLIDDALVEYYRAREDERLGRWRDPDKSWIVAYPTDGFEGEEVTLLDENDAESRTVYRDEISQGSGWWKASAKRYFAAHPQSKPWHAADKGDVWVLTTKNVGDEVAARVAVVNEQVVFEYVKSCTTHIPVTDPRIETARRIWPEGEK